MKTNSIEIRHSAKTYVNDKFDEIIRNTGYKGRETVSGPKFPNVFIFEGGDVCGKTTQSILLAKNLHHCFRHKFPDNWVDINHEDLNIFLKYNKVFKSMIDEITKMDIYFDYEKTKIDIYKIFKLLHSKIYNSDTNKLVDELINCKSNTIENLIKFNIFINSYDKYLWLINDYKTIVDTGKSYNNVKIENIVIDRFITSGIIYNTDAVLTYLTNIIEYNNNETGSIEAHDQEIIWNTMKRINKFSNLCNYVLKETIREINLLEKVRSFYDILDEKIFSLNKDHSINLANNIFFHNFYEIYFEPSQLLYNNFIKLGNDNTREVSEYDTNIKLKYIIENSFENFYNQYLYGTLINTRYYFNLIKVPTDVLLTTHANNKVETMDTPEQVFQTLIHSNYPMNFTNDEKEFYYHVHYLINKK